MSFHQRSMKPWLNNEVLFNASADGKAYNAALKVLHKYTQEVSVWLAPIAKEFRTIARLRNALLQVIENRRREREARRKDSLSVSDKDLGANLTLSYHILHSTEQWNGTLTKSFCRRDEEASCLLRPAT